MRVQTMETKEKFVVTVQEAAPFGCKRVRVEFRDKTGRGELIAVYLYPEEAAKLINMISGCWLEAPSEFNA
jgi:hypothetical protein